jgi:hypothetical protein
MLIAEVLQALIQSLQKIHFLLSKEGLPSLKLIAPTMHELTQALQPAHFDASSTKPP